MTRKTFLSVLLRSHKSTDGLPTRLFIAYTNIFQVSQIKSSVCNFKVYLLFPNTQAGFTLPRSRYETLTIMA